MKVNTSLAIKSLIPGYFFLRHLKNILNPKEEEYLIIAKKLSMYNVFVDVGANLGLYSYLFSKGKKAQVLSCEPNPVLAAYLVKSLADNVEVKNMALGGFQSSKILHVPSDELTSGRSSLLENVAKNYKPELTEFKVKVETLDNLFKPFSKDFRAFVKIDVEGYESNVLEGCKESLELGKKIDFMIELDFLMNPDLEEVIAMMQHYKYKFFCIDLSNNRIPRLIKVDREELITNIKFGQNNIFFSKSESFV